MFDIGWSELLIIAIVAVVVIGPKDLPRAMHTAGKFVRKFKVFAGDMQRSLDKIMHEEEMNEIIREANKAGGDNLQHEIDRQYQMEQARKQALAGQDTAEAKDEEPKANG